MRRAAAYIFVFAAMAAAMGACSNETCDQNQASLPLATFHDYATGKEVSLAGIEIGAIGAPGDSLLNDTASVASRVYLPFSMTADETSFYFRYRGLAPSSYDTLRFAYTRQPYFASEACGAMYRYRIQTMSHTRHLLDSVALLDSVVTNLDVPVMQLYFTTTPAAPRP